MVPQNCSVSHILQNIFLCVQQNKDIHTGLELLEGEQIMTEFYFWVNYPFKCCANAEFTLHNFSQDYHSPTGFVKSQTNDRNWQIGDCSREWQSRSVN